MMTRYLTTDRIAILAALAAPVAAAAILVPFRASWSTRTRPCCWSWWSWWSWWSSGSLR